MEERARISREIHDSLVQYLGSIAGELDAAEMAAEAGAENMVWRHIDRAREGTRQASSEARRLVRAMRPEVLDESSLPEALAVLTRSLYEGAEIETTFEVEGEVRPLAPEVEHALARVVQEGLSNAHKHSHATHAVVSLSFEPSRVTLKVSDNGIGMDKRKNGTAGSDGGFGMRSMRERAERIGGWISVTSTKGAGTTVAIEVPTHGRKG